MVVGRGQNWIPWKVFYCEFSKNLQNTFFKENSGRMLVNQSNYLICAGKNMFRIKNRAKRSLLETENKDNKAT